MSESRWLILFWSFFGMLLVIEQLVAHDRGLQRLRRWPANIGLGVVNGLIYACLPLTVVAAAVWAQSQHIGLLNWVRTPSWLAIATTVVVVTLVQYGFHRSMHASPLLWRIHRVHHSDRHLDATSSLRFHPLELLGLLAWKLIAVLLIGLEPATLAALEIVEVLIGLATHSSLRLPARLERCLAWSLVTPSIHHVHHSMVPELSEKNFGAITTIWDRLLGTFHTPPDVVTPGTRHEVGVTTITPDDAANLDWLIRAPWLPPDGTDRRRTEDV